MMTPSLLRLAMLCAALLPAAAAVFGQTLDQTASIYYAYPEPCEDLREVPHGYEPVYASHYGRHGSRWITEDKRYTDVADVFDKAYSASNLTPLGLETREKLQAVLRDAIGKGGSLSAVGERQHRGIAGRMIEAYPGIFADTSSVRAVSSTSQRCILSMAAFSEKLKERNPSLRITRTAYDKDMDFIAHTSPEGKAFSSDTASWRSGHNRFCRETVRPARLMSSLFINPDFLSVDEQFDLMMGLYWIVSDMQDVEAGVDFDGLFLYDELQAIWRTINARMYLCNADAPLAGGVMKHCADNLLRDIISRADEALDSGSAKADLRFGHDTHLLRLLALMGIEQASGLESRMDKFHEVWRDYELSPMAGNLQMIFFRGRKSDVIVRVLLNEREVSLPLKQSAPGFYDWEVLRSHLIDQLNQ